MVTGAWWDHVDEVAAHLVGGVLAGHRAAVTPVMRAWARDDDLWVRRTAVLSQLRFKADTDTDLLHDVIEANLDDRVVLAAQGDRLGAARVLEDRPGLGARRGRRARRPAVGAVASRGRPPAASRLNRMAAVDLPAGTITYRETGPADGPVVLFVHGFLVDHALWADVPERLAERGFRCLAPTWPLGAHRTPMRPGADLSPRGVARRGRVVPRGPRPPRRHARRQRHRGAVCQLLLDEDPSRVGRLVLTNCDAFDTFPPFPFDVLFRLARNATVGRASCCRPASGGCGPAGSASARSPSAG